MNNRPIIRLADDGRDNLSLWERCRLIVEAGVRKYGDAGGLPISGTGRPRKKKKKVAQGKKKTSVSSPTNRNEPSKKNRRPPAV
jgi:hypothetical protein